MEIASKHWRLIWLLFGAAVGSCLGAPKILEPRQVAREFDQRSWRHEHGLPGNRVWALCQTRDGYLWIGTQKGLARFDGQKFTVFDHVNTPELPNDECRSLAEDSDGNLWIGTVDALIRKAGNRFMRFENPQRLGPSGYPALCASRSGGMWAGGQGKLCLVQADQVRTFSQENALPLSPGLITGLAEQGGVVWVGTSAGLVRFDWRAEQFESSRADPDLEGLEVRATCSSTTGECWALLSEQLPHTSGPVPKLHLAHVVDGRLVKVRAGGAEDIPASFRPCFLAGDRSGALWFSAIGNFINRYLSGEVQLLPMLLGREGDFALCALADRDGNLWIGTEYGGLQRWAPRKITCYTAQDGLAHDNAWSICEARDGSVLVGTDGGLSQFKDGRFTPVLRREGSALENVRAVVEDQGGAVWVGTMRSLECARTGGISPVPLPGEWFESKVRALHSGRDGSLWIGTVKGLTRLKDGERTKYTTADGLAGDEVRAILEDRSGDVWAGTFGGGLSRWHGGRFTTLCKTNGLPSNNVWALAEGAGGVLWVGTEAGLCRLKDGRVTTFGTDQGLPAELINCLVEDDSARLWIGHDQGIFWVETKQLEEVASKRRAAVQAVQYDESDGLLSIETNGQKSNPAACKTRDGHLWFPTTKGVVVIDPWRVEMDQAETLAVIEEVRANGGLVAGDQPRVTNPGKSAPPALPLRAPLRLPPGGARVMQFRWTAAAFLAPGKVRFRYRLAGLDDHWVEVGGRREASFADLRPGAYRFEVIASDHHGIWQNTPAFAAFQVTPFFYETWLFYSLAGALGAGLIALGIWWRVGELRRIHQLERANALNEQRRQIARDIHDELGASLTNIVQLSGDAIQEALDPERVKARAQRISRLAGEAVDQIGEIVWANNPEYDTLEDLVAYVREYAANYFAEREFKTAFDFPETVPSLSVSGLFRRHVVLMVKEALQNISKHSRATQVEIRLALRPRFLELSIADNGCGFANDGSKIGGNGITNMRERTAELLGTFEIRPAPGHGTELRVVLPLPPN